MKLLKALPVILSTIALIVAIYVNIQVRANYNAMLINTGTTTYTINCGQIDEEVGKVKRTSKKVGDETTSEYTLFSEDGSKIGSVTRIYKEDSSGNIYSVETKCDQ